MMNTAADSARAYRRSQRALALALAALFAASAVATIVQAVAMADRGDLPVPGGGAIAAPWLDMCGQAWRQGLLMFMAMWVAMMTAMMLPSLAPVLWRLNKRCAASDQPHAAWLSVCAAAGYLGVWMALGLLAYPLGRMAAALLIQSPLAARLAPLATGVVVLVAAAWQFTATKARWLACCRHLFWGDVAPPASGHSAWRCGMHWGAHCVRCNAGLTIMLLVLGAMDLRVMSGVTVAMTLERVALPAWRMPLAIGVIGVLAGVGLTIRGLMIA